jgi:SRSO17 transposase
VANEAASLPIDDRLYLPKDGAGDPARRAKVGVPEEITVRGRPSIALERSLTIASYKAWRWPAPGGM